MGVDDQWCPGPTTALLGLLGNPVAHSGSPAMHNAAFRAVGRDACYLAFHVDERDVAAAINGLQAIGVAGLNVTVPHKEQALSLADRVTPRAEAAGAANVLAFKDGIIVADNTDGAGFLRALTAAGVEVDGRAVLLIGAGGAARAVAAACAAAGATQLVVANRSPARAEALLSQVPLAGAVGVACPLTAVGHWLPKAQLVIQATSLGLKPGDPVPWSDWAGARPGTTVVDLLYKAGGTPFMHRVRDRGLTVLDGRGMLVWQAALAWDLWFGQLGPAAVMAAALDRWLDRKGD